MLTGERWLTSPGEAVAKRVHIEAELVHEMRVGVAQFLVDVENEARQAQPALVASMGAPGAPESLFTLGRVMLRWEKRVNRRIHRAMARLLGDTHALLVDDYLRGLDERLLRSDLPEGAYRSAREVMRTAAAEGWERSRLTRALTMALDPTTGEATTTAVSAEASSVDTHGWTWHQRAERIARTEATAAYGFVSLNALHERGFTSKRWVARHDDQTRPSHLEVDGQTLPLGQHFIVGGSALMVPADPSGPASQVMNCRCVLVGVGEGLTAAYNPSQPRHPAGSSQGGRWKGRKPGHTATLEYPNGMTVPVRVNSHNDWVDGDGNVLSEEAAAMADALASKKPGQEMAVADNLAEAFPGIERPAGKVYSQMEEYRNCNPDFATDPGAQVNCQSCVVAYELRQRGLDVVAQPGNPGLTGRRGVWAVLDGEFTQGVPPAAERSAQTYSRTVGAIASQNFPLGARGVISGAFAGVAGHIWSWQIDGAGRVRFFDPQCGEEIGPNSHYWPALLPAGLRFARIDNVYIDEDAIHLVRSGR